MFWLASRCLATLALKRPPVHLCIRAGSTSVGAVIRGAGCNHDSFTKGPHLITPKSGHLDTQEDRLLDSSRSELRVASRTTLRSPRLSFHANRISIFSTHTEEISAHLVCQSWPNKPVYVLNTVGTLGIPDRHCHRQVITAITASYYISSYVKMLSSLLSRLP